MHTIEDGRQLYLTEKELDLLKTLLQPGTDFDDDGCVSADATDEVQMQTRLYFKLLKQRRGDVGALWVTTYECTSAYGGPEEGGWWYTHYAVLSSHGFTSPEAAVNDYNQCCRDALLEYDRVLDTFVEISVADLERELTKMPDYADVPVDHIVHIDRNTELMIVIECQLGSQQTVGRPIYC